MSADCCQSEAWSALARTVCSVILHTEHTARASAHKASDRQQSADSIPHAVNHSLALLRMAKNCPKHVELIWRSMNCYCCI